MVSDHPTLCGIGFEVLRSFNAKNIGSVGQRAAKLPAVKVGGLKKSLPTGPGLTQTSRPQQSITKYLNHIKTL